MSIDAEEAALSRIVKHLLLAVIYGGLVAFISVVVVYVNILESRPDLRPWHLAELDEEFEASDAERIGDVSAYLELEDRLFSQLHDEVYKQLPPEERRQLNRYHAGSLSDPEQYAPNWNRTFELPVQEPRGGILLLHGQSDSPYTWRTLGQVLHSRGLWVLSMRMPGHGTAPSGLVHATWEDAAAAMRLGVRHVRNRIGPEQPLYIGGYSTGAALAVQYSLAVLEGEEMPKPDALVLLSPAIGVPAVAALAVWQSRLGDLAGLEKLAWLSIQPEYDPYKYNSFAVNAGDLVYQLTLQIEGQIQRLDQGSGIKQFPRVLAFQSVVDATVPTRALIDRLYRRLAPEGHELVLLDINRNAEAETLFGSKPEDVTATLYPDHALPFALTAITNVDPSSNGVHAFHKAALSDNVVEEPLDLSWPRGVYSLSHVAIPFPPDDPMYGDRDVPSTEGLNLGRIELRGEKGILLVPADQLTRLRFNPFYSYMRGRILEFLSLGQ